MPELPEVENIAQGLRSEILGRKISQTLILQPLIVRGPYRRVWKTFLPRLAGRKIVCVTRRAKRLIISLDNHLAIIIQLGMTGTVRLADPATPPLKHTHLIIKFKSDNELRLIDPRRFGRVWLLDHLDPADPDPAMLAAGMSPLGPEPDAITPHQFQQMLGSKRVIKTLLLDQTRIAGLGNIYADESLFAAGIHPATPAHKINILRAKKLRTAIRSVLRRAIRAGGTTFNDFRNAYGDMGSFLKHLRAYQRTGQPCRRCHTPIQRLVLAGRSTHFCPHCQPRN